MSFHERLLDAEINQLVEAVKAGQYSRENLNECYWYYLMKFANVQVSAMYDRENNHAKDYFLYLALYTIYGEATSRLAN